MIRKTTTNTCDKAGCQAKFETTRDWTWALSEALSAGWQHNVYMGRTEQRCPEHRVVVP